ncbi:MAG: rod shape-determining protein MreC [Verrucomicrobiales bacterium]|nr:rod shape-determining protein MreC [Verrucomicrobiales bacterium]
MRRINVLALLLFLAALVWVFFFPDEKTQAIQRTVGSWFSPFTRTGAKVQDALSGVAEEDKNPEQLRTENQALRVEVDQLRIQQRDYEGLKEENATLRALLDFRKRFGLLLIPAEIINRRQSAWYREALIDKGLKHQVLEQTPVITAVRVTDGNVERFEPALVGKVGRAEDNSATVVFVTDENCRVAATIKGSSSIRGILMGSRSSTREVPDLRLRFLRPDQVLDAGRQVVSEGITVEGRLAGVFPSGILLGEVKDFIPGDGTAEATVRPAVDFQSLRYVFVLQRDEIPGTAGNAASPHGTSRP